MPIRTTSTRVITQITLPTALMLAFLTTNSTAARTERLRGCGTLQVPSHPWHSKVAGGSGPEHGDHWIVASSTDCRFALVRARDLITQARRFGDKALFKFDGGNCVARHELAHETITPFANVECRQTEALHHRILHPLIYVQVDPDPRYIHR